MTQHQCEEARKKGYKEVDAYYDPRINEISKLNAIIRKNKGNPHNYSVEIGGKAVSYDDLERKLIKEKEVGKKAVDHQITEECEKGLVPAQKIMDDFVAIQSLGISKILPKGMTHIDVADILAGYPLGGPGSIFNVTRDGILKKLGIGGDLGKAIRDPLKPVRDVLKGLGL